eukprot:12135262-Alexandrium_andersonii.AAC.1
MKVREEAQRALFRMSDARALSASARARPRRQPQEDLRPNDVVFVWRSAPRSGRRGWVGGGLLVAKSPNAGSLWITMRGRLLKCSAQQARRATEPEYMGTE